jgi:hypothetical protein
MLKMFIYIFYPALPSISSQRIGENFFQDIPVKYNNSFRYVPYVY